MLRVSSRSRLIHLTLTGMTVALCGRPFREQSPSDQPGPTAPVCRRCARTAVLHPLDGDPPGYHLTATSTGPGQVTAADPTGRTISTADTIGLARFHAWDHAHTTALATARLRRDRRRIGPADHETWRVLLAAPTGRWRPAGTIHTRTDGFLADLDDADTHAPRRFRSRHQARRWIIEHRVVHGWPHTGWLVLDGTRLLRRTSSRHAATRWLRGYHATFTGLRATAIRPVGLNAYQHRYPDGSVFTIACATRIADHGIDPAAAPRYPYDDLPFDEGAAPAVTGTP
ncbi:hypothetical protein [Parafrankia elaeagni]|uniref:hypothetical protein n=1 Tax=Parafrankia elaeagni TaxID=222534 RepID=UPI0006847979|nr:hypothetical protein [Parafrankia elaeagni]